VLAVGTLLTDEGEFGDIIRKLGLSDTIYPLGVRSDIVNLLAAADVLLLTSRVEGFPNAVLEAMCAGLPVVSTNVGGVSELVLQEKTGILHPVGDIQGMAGSLKRLLKNPSLREKMGARANKRVLENFNVDKLVERTLRQYMELLHCSQEETA
jgi:glycosyltransferase involved in cell wall biosynthesis